MDSWQSTFYPDVQPPDESNDLRKALRDVLEIITLSIILFVVINAISARIRVESISMEPNLVENDLVIVNKLAYQIGVPERGDIIVFRYPPNPNETPYIKRVIGLPGEEVRISDGKVYIDGQVITEPYLDTITNRPGTWRVPDGNLFVMGDNRTKSSDSRAWGMVPLENVIGKAEVVYWPLDHIDMLDFPSAAAAQP